MLYGVKMKQRELISYVCGINIFFNIIIMGAAIFPYLIFPIDYNSKGIVDALVSLDSLFFDGKFYLFADYYSEYYMEITNFATFTFYLTGVCSIVGSIQFKKSKYFIFIAVFLDFISPIMFPTFVNRWEINFILNTCIILNVFIFSYYYLYNSTLKKL